MRELAGLGYEQIAAALDTSPAAAKQAVYEARRALAREDDPERGAVAGSHEAREALVAHQPQRSAG